MDDNRTSVINKLRTGSPRWVSRIVVILVFVLALFLAYLLKDFFGKYILEPMILLYRISLLIIKALPQAIWWGIFVFVLGLLTLQIFRPKVNPVIRKRQVEDERISRARFWTRMTGLETHGDYSKWLLSRQAAKLVVEIIAHQERLTLGQACNYIQEKKITLPADIRDYVEIGLNIPTFNQYSEMYSTQGPNMSPLPLDLDPEILVEYLENRIKTGGLA